MRTYNEADVVNFARTFRFDAAPDAAERAALERSIVATGGRVDWRDDAPTGRTYVLAESPEPIELGVVGTAYPSAIIALAVTPRPAEAFPALVEAFAGAGRPVGLLECTRVGDELVLAWDPDVSSSSLVLALVDAELRRFAGTRVTRSLAPIPVAIATAVAAEGLAAPGIVPSRILETYLEAPHGHA